MLTPTLISFSQDVFHDSAYLIKEFRKADAWYQRSANTERPDVLTELQESNYKMTAFKRYMVLDTLLENNPLHYDSLHFIVATRTAELAHYFDSLSIALHYYTEAILLLRHLPQIPDSLVFRSYLFAGQIYFGRSQLDEAAVNFRKAEEIQDHYKTRLPESERLYNSFGVLYFQEGNYLQASNYFRKAAQLLDHRNVYFKDFYVNYNINYATALFKLERYDEAGSILNGLLPFKLHVNEILNNIGLIGFAKGNFSRAMQNFNKVQYDNSMDVGMENDKAGTWLAMKQYDSCETHVKIALAKNIQYNGNHAGFDHGLTLKIYGDLKAALKEYPAAVQYFQQAMAQFYPAFKEKNIHSNPQMFSGVFSYMNLFKTLVAKAGAFHSLYLASSNTDWEKEELKIFMTVFDLLDYIERVYESDEARLFLEKSRYLIHEQPINLAFELYTKTNNKNYLENAYEIDQRTKATLLAFNDQRNQLLHAGSEIKAEELNLRKAITRLSISAETITDPAVVEAISGRIHELEISLNKVQESVERNYPTNKMTVPAINSLQRNFLDNKTQLLSFHISGNSLSVFSVTKTAFSGVQRNMYPAFRADLDGLIKRLHGHDDSLFSPEKLNRLSTFLLQDVKPDKFPALIIIPDDELNYLPFESLKFGGGFLIEHAAVQYQFSSTLLKTEKENFKTASIVSFAPFSGDRYHDSLHEFDQLRFSIEETSTAGGRLFAGTKATKQNFLNNLNNTDIIHLATHAVAGDSLGPSSYIAFAPWGMHNMSDYLLYSKEIYNLSMRNNKLIILSACETGYGTLVKGEGVMSLSRAFAYAGCPDIITSLWKADDEATSYLVTQIHANLRMGLSVSKSIQEAKKTYLADKRINPRRKDPVYWANLIFVGNYSPVTVQWQFYLLIGLGVMALLICILAFWQARNKRKS